MLHRFWRKNYSYKNDCIFYKLIFLFLRLSEFFYTFFFQIILFYKKRCKAYVSPFKVISIGNISCGGTGKTVITRFLIEKLSHQKGAVFIRGYKGSNEKKSNSFIITPTNKYLDTTPSLVGDEALMLAFLLNIPVVVGKNRVSSSLALEQYQKEIKETYSFVVLDDGYQYFKLKKDYEILVCDARAPFENNRCLPAGKLREKDVSRANCIICTHSEQLSLQERNTLKGELSQKLGSDLIFFGYYTLHTIINDKEIFIPLETVASFDLVACAGIGSFLGFKDTLHQFNLFPKKYLEYKDHHYYSFNDMEQIKDSVKSFPKGAMLTTRKDWYKLKSLWIQLSLNEQFPIFCIDITFSFCSPNEELRFFKNLLQCVGL